MKEGSKKEFVSWKGRRIPLTRQTSGWRLRSRSKYFSIDLFLHGGDLEGAKRRAKLALDEGTHHRERKKRDPGAHTVQDLVEVYLATPKRTALISAKCNVSRLAAIVRKARGKSLDEFPIRLLGPDLWTDYQRLRYEAIGRTLDYTQRLRDNVSINAAVRAARCLFIERLRPAYQRAGIHLPPDVALVSWLPDPVLVRPEADDEALIEAWAALRETDHAMWVVIGLARFAGLRLAEIAAARRSWIVTHDGMIAVELRDRPEDHFQHKTGRPYFAPILHGDLAAALCASPEGLLVQPAGASMTRARWLDNVPQRWVRPFVGDAVLKPLHRLRGLYADQLARETKDAVAARLAGLRAAQEGLGHTSSQTTERHYLSQ